MAIISAARKQKCKHRIKYYIWLFRWFIIGDLHCRISERKKFVLRILNRLFWFFVVVLIPCGVAYLLGL